MQLSIRRCEKACIQRNNGHLQIAAFHAWAPIGTLGHIRGSAKPLDETVYPAVQAIYPVRFVLASNILFAKKCAF